MSRRPKVLLIGAIAAVALFVGGPWVYINVVREPAAESFLDQIASDTTVVRSSASGTTVAEAAPAAESSLDDASGTWTVSAESQVGYRVDEVLFGQNVTAVGRTNSVTGSVTIDGSTVVAAEFSADMTSVRSDDSRRDAQFEGRIMDVINHPVATFRLDDPITFASEALSRTIPHSATGTLALRGTSRTVEVRLVSSVDDGRVLVVGEIPIVFADWGIPNPSIPGISTEDSGILEFNLVLER